MEWLGQIPAQWELKRRKTISTVRLSNIDKRSVEGQELIQLCNHVDVYYNERIVAVCVVSCQRSPEPVFLKWKGMEATPEGDFFVRSGPGTVKLPPNSAHEYIRTRFRGLGQAPKPEAPSDGDV